MEVPQHFTGEENTVSVFLSNTHVEMRKVFRCVLCGKIVFEYFKDVEIIMPGYEEVKKVESPLVVRCQGTFYNDQINKVHRCKVKYYIFRS